MITIPNIPTDHLYKFLSITGLFLILIGLFYPKYQASKIQYEYFEIIKDTIITSSEASRLNSDIDKFTDHLHQQNLLLDSISSQSKMSASNPSKHLDILDKIRTDKDFREYLKFTYDYRSFLNRDFLIDIDSNNSTIDILYRKNEELFFKRKEISHNMNVLSFKLKELHILKIYSFILIGLGIFLSVIGFYFWYFKIQIYLDEKIKKDSFC